MSVEIKNKVDISKLREINRLDHSHTPAELGAAAAGSTDKVLEALNEHRTVKISSEEGAHDIRWFDNQLQVFIEGAWQPLDTAMMKQAGPALGNITDVKTIEANSVIYIKWTDPENSTNENGTEIRWAGTRIIRKAGSPPISPSDGVLILDSKIKNQFSTQYLPDRGLINGVKYYYYIMPYTDQGIYTTDIENMIVAEPTGEKRALEDVTNVDIRPNIEGTLLNWTDPDDLVIDGVTLAKWAGTKVIRKARLIPANENDGVLIADCKIKNQHASQPLSDHILFIYNTDYYYRFFPYTEDGIYHGGTSQKIQLEALYNGSSWHHSDSDSAGARAGNVGSGKIFTPGIGNASGKSPFDNSQFYKQIRLCNLVEGKVTAYEGDRNFSRNPTYGDVMVEIPKFYVSFGYNNNNTMSYAISIDGNMPIGGSGSSFISPAHQGNKYHPKDYDRIYISAYLLDNRLRSTSGSIPMKYTQEYFINYCRWKGNGYNVWSFAAYWTIALLYLIEVADYNCQKAIGLGRVNADEPITNGTTDNIPYHSGRTAENNGTGGVKYRHMENLWGSLWQPVQGAWIDKESHIYISNEPTAWKDKSLAKHYWQMLSYKVSDQSGYAKNFGFDERIPWALLPTTVGATGSTYLSSGFSRNESPFIDPLGIGGTHDSGDKAGLFAYSAGMSFAEKCGCRLMYLPEN